MSLHDELQRLADTAPRPGIDHDLWDRGRALRRRDRWATSAVVLAMVVIMGGFVALVTGPPRAIAPAGETVPEGAIPSRIYDVPSDAPLPLEKDLAIGQASVAFVSSSGHPVVIGASDGAYHPLDLPRWERDSALTLSPSGAQLAWLSARTGPPDPVISVLTIATGEVETTGIAHGAGLRPTSISWSPDGERLAWLGQAPFGSAFGTVEVAAVDSESPASSHEQGLVGIAVANDGTLALGTTSGGLILDADKHDRRKIAETDGFPANFSPDGTVLALETQIASPLSSTLEVSTEKQWRHPFPADTLEPATTRPLGWLDDRLQLISAQESFDEDAEFVITTPTLGQTSTWRRSVGSVEPPVAASLSVAVDLIPDLDGTSSQRFAHDFGEPDWAGERDISWMIGLGVAGALSVLYGLRWVWRRRTSSF